MIDKKFAIPRIEAENVSDKIRMALINLIRNNAGQDDAPFKLPNEDELSQRFGVSRNVLRDALMSLEEMGIITRRRGRGTIANPKIARSNRLDITPAIFDAIRREGKETWFQTINCEHVNEPDAAFEVKEPGYLRIQKLFYSGEDALAYCENRILGKYAYRAAGHFNEAAALNHTEFLKQYCNTSLAFIMTEINVKLAEEWLAKHLQITCDRPILMLEDCGYNLDHEIIIHSYTYFHESAMPLKFLRKYWYRHM